MACLRLSTCFLALCLLTAGGALAQETADPEEERIYLQEEPDWDEKSRALGIGIGLVELGDNVIVGQILAEDDDVETYFTLNLRLPVGDREAHGTYGGRSGFRAFVEPEIGYWETSSSSDLLLGVNLVGAMPLNAVEFFVGGGLGVHLLDFDDQVVAGRSVPGRSDEALGVNAHFGVDVSLGRAVSVFATGRFDLVDDSRDEFEGKAFLGLRFRF